MLRVSSVERCQQTVFHRTIGSSFTLTANASSMLNARWWRIEGSWIGLTLVFSLSIWADDILINLCKSLLENVSFPNWTCSD